MGSRRVVLASGLSYLNIVSDAHNKTGFDKFFDEQMRDAKFRDGYEKIRREIALVDALVRALDAARRSRLDRP